MSEALKSLQQIEKAMDNALHNPHCATAVADLKAAWKLIPAICRNFYELSGLPIETAPKDGTPIVTGHLVRYLPYKPDGKRQMKAEGRWQEFNGYGWDNINWEPTEWKPANSTQAEIGETL